MVHPLQWRPLGFLETNGALLLVWFGNAYAIHRTAPNEALWVTLVASASVPSTTLVGKVLGEQGAVQVAVSTSLSSRSWGGGQALAIEEKSWEGALEGNLGRVLEFLRERGGKDTAREVAERLEVSVKTARRYLNKLAAEGKARWNGEGWECTALEKVPHVNREET